MQDVFELDVSQEGFDYWIDNYLVGVEVPIYERSTPDDHWVQYSEHRISPELADPNDTEAIQLAESMGLLASYRAFQGVRSDYEIAVYFGFLRLVGSSVGSGRIVIGSHALDMQKIAVTIVSDGADDLDAFTRKVIADLRNRTREHPVYFYDRRKLQGQAAKSRRVARPRPDVLARVCEAHRLIFVEHVSKSAACASAGTDPDTYRKYARNDWLQYCKNAGKTQTTAT